MDLSQLSDQDLQAIASGDMKSVSDEGLQHIVSQASPPQQEPENPYSMKNLGRSMVDAIPMAGGIVGGAFGGTSGFLGGMGLGAYPGAVVGSGIGYGAGVGIKDAINSYFDPERAPKSVGENFADVAKGIPTGMVQEAGSQLIGAGIGAVANRLAKPVGSYAEDLAEAATGATGKQASYFKPGTGRALLDNGIVKFGRSQAGIAEAAQEALDTEGETIGSIIKHLSDEGATGSREDLLSGIQSKIDELAGNAGEADTIRKLNAIKEDIAAAPENPSLSLMENTKRSFQEAAKRGQAYDAQSAQGVAADLYKEAAESVATKANPDAAEAFTKAKTLYGQLAPVAKASAARASQLNQSPIGGLGDYVAYGAGGVPGVIAKKIVMPRAASSLAATANGLSQILKTSPQTFGKWAVPLANAAARGEMSLNAADYILQQTDPGYRQKRNEMNSSPNDDQNEPVSIPQAGGDDLYSTSSFNKRSK